MSYPSLGLLDLEEYVTDVLIPNAQHKGNLRLTESLTRKGTDLGGLGSGRLDQIVNRILGSNGLGRHLV